MYVPPNKNDIKLTSAFTSNFKLINTITKQVFNNNNNVLFKT